MPIKFGTDGWRAVIADEYTFANVKLVSQAVARMLLRRGGKQIVVGYDTRFLSEEFARTAAETLASAGLRTLLTATATPTPVTSYSILWTGSQGAVVITASHNPGRYNGYKYKPEYAGSAAPEVVAQIEEGIKALEAGEAPPRAASPATVETFDASERYLRRIGELVDLVAIRAAGLKVVVDAMFGAGAGYLEQLLSEGRTQVTSINAYRNPIFPGIHGPEPIAANLGQLMSKVVAEGADAGVALDGDADRVGLVSEKGEFVNQLQVFGLLTLYLLEVKGWRGPIVKSLSTTSMVDKLGQLYGVPVYTTPVGFKYIGPKMMETEAIIGGEESGGFGFRGHIPERDGILASLYLLDMVLRMERRPSELIKYLYDKVGPHYYDRIDLEFPEGRRADILAKLQANPPKELAGKPVTQVDTRDGFKYFDAQGNWLLIRFSGTEPLVRIYSEADSPETVRAILEDGLHALGV
jgi:phosphomannomutase